MRKYFDITKRTTDLLSILCALSHDNNFITHIVNDARSFDMAVYDGLLKMVDGNQLILPNY
jgi:hypothetical protein